MGLFGKDRKQEMRDLVAKGREVYIDHRDGKLTDQDLAQVYIDIKAKNLWPDDTRKRHALSYNITESMRGNISIDEATETIYAAAYSKATEVYCWECGFVHDGPACGERGSW